MNSPTPSNICPANPVPKTRFEYGAASQQVSVTDALGNTSTTVFDAVGRTSATINANGATTTQVFDGIGQLTAVVDVG